MLLVILFSLCKAVPYKATQNTKQKFFLSRRPLFSLFFLSPLPYKATKTENFFVLCFLLAPATKNGSFFCLTKNFFVADKKYFMTLIINIISIISQDILSKVIVNSCRSERYGFQSRMMLAVAHAPH